jgi:hypothetical protein
MIQSPFYNLFAIQGYTAGLPQASNTSSELNTILSIIIGIVAALSVLFIVIGGMRYVLSAGEPKAAAKARSTIIHAAIGLLIAVTAEGIVAFALNTIIGNK